MPELTPIGTLAKRPSAGDQIRLMERGELTGPFTVTSFPGRSSDHLVCHAATGPLFETYWDEFSAYPPETAEPAVLPHTDLIGLIGRARSGKDTIGAHLVTKYGFTREPITEGLRTTLYALNPYVRLPDTYAYASLVSLVDDLGWEQAKLSHPDVRRLLQRMGTEAGRAIHGDDLWTDLVSRRIQTIRDAGGRAVVTDLRLPHEADWLRSLGGLVIKVVRPGQAGLAGAEGTHDTETLIDQAIADTTIVNDGTIAQLYERADHLVLTHV